MDAEGTFTCRDCKTPDLPVSASVKDKSRKRGIMERCKPCGAKRAAALRKDNTLVEVSPGEFRTRAAIQRQRVRGAMRARREFRKEDGLPWTSELTPRAA